MELMRTKTDKNRRFQRWYLRKVITYVVICTFLTFVNWFTSPRYWWVLWVIAGWGLEVLLNGLFHVCDCDDNENYDS